MKTFLTEEIPSQRFISVRRSVVQVKSALEPPAIQGVRFLAKEQQFVPRLPIHPHNQKHTKTEAKHDHCQKPPQHERVGLFLHAFIYVHLYIHICLWDHVIPGKGERKGSASPALEKTDLKGNENIMVGFWISQH